MATVMIELDDEAAALLDSLVDDGAYATRDEAVLAGLQFARVEADASAASMAAMTPEQIAAIEEGIADARAGRTYPAEQVFAELRQRYTHWPR